MKVLIVGAGIAGPTLAYWLAHYGMEPVLVEKSPRLRTGGYIIDFWGIGFDIAERMGLLPEIRRKGYMMREVRIVNSAGKPIAGFPVESVSRLMQGRYISLARGDLAATIYDGIAGTTETIFNDTITRIEQSGDSVGVAFKSGAVRDFDLVVGADGLHSQVREIVFGPESQFENYLGYKVAAFEVEGYTPRDELVYLMYTEVGQQVGRFAMHGDRTMFLFIFADPSNDAAEVSNIPAQKALLRKRFGKGGWECRHILNALDDAHELYFDRVSQIHLGNQIGSWTHGRVTLTGDAAFCVSLLAGQGSALAMIAAYILAGELHRANGDVETALAQYQQRFQPFILKKQHAALRFAGFFAPESASAMFFRNQVLNLMKIPFVASLAVGRDLVDSLVLPEY